MAAIRVLVVDDEKKILRAVERLFFEDKYDVMTASSAKDGLSILSDVMPVWVVISDYRMPEMNGIEFLKHVNRRWPDVVKVILSGYGDSGKVIPFIDEGKIDKLILKPWNNNELRVSITNAVEIYELRKRNRELADELNRTNSTLQDLNNNMEEIIADKTAELESIQKDVAQAERLASLKTIAAGIAHEVKSPLERIIEEAGYVRSALPGDARITDGAETIKKASLRAGRAIKGLLSFSSQHSLEKSLTDVTGVIEDVLSSVEYQIRLRNIEVVRKFYPGVTEIMIDGARMREMFINILSNSIEAMPEGGTIIIRSRRVKDKSEKRYLQVTFDDDGCGIPREEIQRVFDPFFTTQRGAGKTGLGLSIAKGIVESHGGTIRVESRVGRGTKVFIRVPAGDENEQLQ